MIDLEGMKKDLYWDFKRAGLLDREDTDFEMLIERVFLSGLAEGYTQFCSDFESEPDMIGKD